MSALFTSIGKFLSVSTVLFLAFVFNSNAPAMRSHITWVDDFNKEEKEKLSEWLDGVSGSITETLGEYPFSVELYVHRSNAGEPVLWANTVRNGEQGVHFHVNPSFSLKDFQKDWTAPHEIAHLSIPNVGSENMWFSEGYASFMQYQVLQTQGMFSPAEVEAKYMSKLENTLPEYDSDQSFIKVYKRLKKRYNYPAVYWGGACFFHQADALLRKEKNVSLTDVISHYQQAGRKTDDSMEAVVSSLDKVSGSTIFSNLLNTFQHGSAREAVMHTSINVKD